jgi:hypothetical protein
LSLSGSLFFGTARPGAYRYAWCAALYGPGGDVIGLQKIGQRTTGDRSTRSLPMSYTLYEWPADAESVRFLIWQEEPGAPGRGITAVRISDQIPIQ